MGGARSDSAAPFADEDALKWEDYARDSGRDEAGAELPADLIDSIAQERAAVPAEPGLTPWRSGHMYTGAKDKAHVAYLNGYFEDRARRANPTDRRKIQAFRAFQAREGSTAAINTYDNQIVTWGTGWGGLGWMGKVVERASASPKVRELFRRCGLRYRSKNVYDVVDLEARRCVTGSRDALVVIQRSIPLLNVLIHAARAPETRDAVTEAQLATFMQSAADFPGEGAVATQALFNLIAHLKHWAPGYVVAPGKWVSCLEWALPQVGGDKPSAERDQRLAPLVGQYFYGMPKKLKMKWIPDWKQMKIYWKHMKDDGLDCLGDAFIQASSPPADDPFAAAPAATPIPVAAPAPAISAKVPVAAAPPPAPTEANKPDAASASALKGTAQADPRPALKSAPLAGEAELERIARGQGALRKGSKGAAVKALQEALIALSFDVSGGADGLFGPGLERTVKAFQAARGLTADGVVGPGTLKAMDATLGALHAAS